MIYLTFFCLWITIIWGSRFPELHTRLLRPGASVPRAYRPRQLLQGGTQLVPGPGPDVTTYAMQFLQLQARGFYNIQRNMDALQTATGNVDEAERVLLHM